MQRPGQCGDAGGNAAIHIGKRAGDNAGREGRGIQFVVGMQDKTDVEHPCLFRVGFLAAEHVKEILRDVQCWIGSHDNVPVADTVPRCRDRADLTGKLYCRRHCVLAVGAVAVAVVKIERRNGRPKHIHRIGFFRKCLKHFENLVRQAVIRADLGLKIGKLAAAAGGRSKVGK